MTSKIFSRLTGLALVGALALFAGCASGPAADESAEAPAEPAVVIEPKVGMTQAQVKTMYGGEPDSVTTASDGSQTWSYHMNAGEMWIPFNFGYRPEYHVLHFDTAGNVTSYEITD